MSGLADFAVWQPAHRWRSSAAARVSRRWSAALARRIGMVAAPKKDRWHTQPTAMLGGVAIFAAVMIWRRWL